MPFTDFTKDVARQLSRTGSVFVSDDAATTWYDLGNVKNVRIQTAANVTDPNTAGRIKQLSSNITGTIVMMQTDVEELDNIDLLTDPSGAGLWLKITNECTDAAGADAAAGIVFKNVNFKAEPDLDFNGNESMIALEFTGRVSNSVLTGLGTSGEIEFC